MEYIDCVLYKAAEITVGKAFYSFSFCAVSSFARTVGGVLCAIAGGFFIVAVALYDCFLRHLSIALLE